MKRTILVFFGIGLLAAFSRAEQMRTNPAQPLHRHPDRILKLTEVLRIPIEGEEYFYEGARDVQLDNKGNLYICDSASSARKSHLLKFSPDGRFLKDLYRQGEGPGEIQSTYDFAVNGSNVFLYDSMKRKIVVEDSDGNYKTQFNKEASPFDTFYGIYEEWLVFGRRIYPLERKTSRLYDIKNAIILLSKDGKIEKEIGAFNNQMFFISLSQGGGMMSGDPFQAALGDDRMFNNLSQDYRIQILDLKSGKTAGQWTRDYPRIEHAEKDWEKKFVSQFNAPKRRFENDITDLLYGDGFLWVRTSTESKEKGFLYDVFDSQGRFADSFFINIKGRVLRIAEGFLYASHYESEAEPVAALVKYRIGEALGGK